MIGKSDWIFNGNHRIYGKDKGAPIWREHWQERKITGETNRSWITETGAKIPKKSKHYGVCFTDEELEQKVWANENAYKIRNRIDERIGAEKLKAIEAILNS